MRPPRPFARRKSRAYYFVGLCSLGLAFGLTLATLTGGGILSGTGLEREAHGSEWVVAHGEGSDGHDQTFLGDVLFGKKAIAHAGGYCGHGSRFVMINGTWHKQAFWRELGGGRHEWRGSHWVWGGTGYVRVSGYYYDQANCH